MFNSPKRNHFTVIIERLYAIFAFLFIFLFSSLKNYGPEIFTLNFYRTLLYNAQFYNDKILISIIAITAFCLWYLFISVRYWKKTTFHVEGTDFVYEKKTLFSASSRLPIENIAVVNVERNIFERLIGTAKVKIDLNSSRTASATDFKFVLKYNEAVLLKETLMQIKQSITDSDISEKAEDTNRTTVASFSNTQAVITKLLSFPILQTLLIIFIFYVLPKFETSGNTDSNATYFLILALLGYISTLVFGSFNLCNYLVEKNENMIYISCGLINKRNYVFESEKINAVIINQPVIARLCGLVSIDLAVVGLGNEKNETTHLSLMVTKKRAEEILSLCAPDFKCTAPLRHPHPLSLVAPVIRAFIFGAAALLLKSVYTNYLFIAVAVFVIWLLGAVGRYKILTFAADDEILTYSTGIFNKKTFFFKYGDIQNVFLRTNAVYKKFGLGRMGFSILAASAVKDHKTGLFKFDDFDSIAEKVTEHKDNLFLNKKSRM